MQALTVRTSASEYGHSSLTPCLDFETLPSRKALAFSHFPCHGPLCFSRCFRGSRVRACCIGRKFRLRCKSISSSTGRCVVPLSEPKKGSLSASAFALTWALEDEPVASNDSAEKELGHLSDLSGAIDYVKGPHSELDELQETCSGCDKKNDGTQNGDDDGGNNDHEDEDDQGRESNPVQIMENGNSPRIDVSALALKLRLAQTADDVEQVLKGKENLPLQVCSIIIKGFGKENRLKSAMALFEWLKRKSTESDTAISPNIFIYNSVLGAMKVTRKFDQVDEILIDMASVGVHPNVITFNTLMGIYIEQGREIKALELFADMPMKGVSPSPASYFAVIFAYRRMEDGFGALTFFAEVKNKYQTGELGKDDDENWAYEFAKLESYTTRVCYQVMRRWLVKSDHSSSDVVKLLKEMYKTGLQPSRKDHEKLIWACTREEHCFVAKELYSRIREMGTEISLSVCNHVIWLMGKAKKWWSALEIYENLLDEGPQPNNHSYELIVSHFSILLSAAKERGTWRRGVRLLNKMEEKGLKPGSKEWNSVLIACSRAAEASAAIEIFKRMVEHGEKPTIISYGALLSALEKGKLYDEALQVWKHMTKVGIEPNLYTYTIMASIYAGQGKFDIVDSIIREMVTVGVEPTVVTFNAIMSGCARNALGSAAYEWFQRMKLQNVTPTEISYEILIQALAKDGKPRLAYELHLMALKEGLGLSTKAYDAVIQSSQTYGATIDVDALGPRPPEPKKTVQTRKNLSEFRSFADVPWRSEPFDKSVVYIPQSGLDLHR